MLNSLEKARIEVIQTRSGKELNAMEVYRALHKVFEAFRVEVLFVGHGTFPPLLDAGGRHLESFMLASDKGVER